MIERPNPLEEARRVESSGAGEKPLVPVARSRHNAARTVDLKDAKAPLEGDLK